MAVSAAPTALPKPACSVLQCIWMIDLPETSDRTEGLALDNSVENRRGRSGEISVPFKVLTN